MLNIQEAMQIAQQYLSKQTIPFIGFKYHLESPKIYLNHFYFDFILETTNNKVSSETPLIGGACGFTIHQQTKKIEVLSFADVAALEIKYQQLENLYEDVLKIKARVKTISSIKTKYQLSTKDLLQIKKHLQQENIDQQFLYQLLNPKIV